MIRITAVRGKLDGAATPKYSVGIDLSSITWFTRLGMAAAMLAGQAMAMPAENNEGAGYHLAASIPGPDGQWDYAAVDPQARRLYLARSGVTVLDLDTHKWLDTIAPGAHVNGVLPVPALHKLIFSDGTIPGLVIYDMQEQRIVGSIPSKLRGRTDAVAYDSSTHIAALMTALPTKPGDIAGGDGIATLVNVEQLSPVGSVALGGRPEFAVSDDHGTMYINVSTNNEIAVLDEAKQRVVRRIPLAKECKDPSGFTPSGLAYDAALGLLVSACHNVAKVIRASDGAELATLQIGEGADAVIIDAVRRRVFVPSGDSGNMSIIDISDTRNLSVIATIKTQPSARLGALDPKTGALYLPAAKLGPPKPPNPFPSVAPGTFKLLVVAPN